MEFKAQGNKLFGQGKIQEAVAAYSKGIDKIEAATDEGTAVNLSEEDLGCLHILYSNRSMVHLDCCKVDEALQDAECSIDNNPNFAKAYLRRAAVLMDLFDFKSALIDLEKAEELDPGAAPEGCEGRLRCSGEKRVNNCYLKKQLELQKKHKCDYVLQTEEDGTVIAEPLTFSGPLERRARVELRDAKACAADVDGSFLVAAISRASDPSNRDAIPKNVQPIKAQLRREFGPDRFSFQAVASIPGKPPEGGPEYVAMSFSHAAIVEIVRVHGPLGISHPERSEAILFPGAPHKWLTPRGCKRLRDHLKLSPNPPSLEELRDCSEEYMKYRQVNLIGKDRDERKCEGCGQLIPTSDPPECLCGDYFCGFMCHKKNWPRHQRKCVNRTSTECSLGGFRITCSFWQATQRGVFPLKDERNFVALWKERGITLENHDNPLEEEEKFYHENEMMEHGRSLHGTLFGSGPEQRIGRLMDILVRLSTPLPEDSAPRIAFKIRAYDRSHNMIPQLASTLETRAVLEDFPPVAVVAREKFAPFLVFVSRSKTKMKEPGMEFLQGFLAVISTGKVHVQQCHIDWLTGAVSQVQGKYSERF